MIIHCCIGIVKELFFQLTIKVKITNWQNLIVEQGHGGNDAGLFLTKMLLLIFEFAGTSLSSTFSENK